ncbi:MAG: DUF4838 domain-containing protein [Marinilabiliales bacterium]|nr:DUF4838 domain-containing protein [Marinilabiliales bacterium]
MAALFPDKTISTLAYQYSRPAPRLTRPAPNVEVMLCTIELNRSRPIADDPSSRLVRPRHRGLGPDQRQPLPLGLHGQLLPPRLALPEPPRAPAEHPVLRRQRRPQALPADEHRPGPRVQRAQVLPAGPAALGPGGRTSTPVVNEFLDGYYGQAGPCIGEVHRRPDRERSASRGAARHLRAAGRPRRGLSLRRPDVAHYDELLRQGRSGRRPATPSCLVRVRTARLPLMYADARDRQGRHVRPARLLPARRAGGSPPKPGMTRLLEDFFERVPGRRRPDAERVRADARGLSRRASGGSSTSRSRATGPSAGRSRPTRRRRRNTPGAISPS